MEETEATARGWPPPFGSWVQVRSLLGTCLHDDSIVDRAGLAQEKSQLVTGRSGVVRSRWGDRQVEGRRCEAVNGEITRRGVIDQCRGEGEGSSERYADSVSV